MKDLSRVDEDNSPQPTQQLSALDEGNFTRVVSFHLFFSFCLRDRVYRQIQLQVKRTYAFVGKRPVPCTFLTLLFVSCKTLFGKKNVELGSNKTCAMHENKFEF